ncbi:hypothetical protein GALL_489490 [mine drainage metagenome]|uniref:Uncharacterized protein n=1 Tax=mine drainage metagenome TaxID=410659 RepID=A0A1J5PPE1_9ZZZZ
MLPGNMKRKQIEQVFVGRGCRDLKNPAVRRCPIACQGLDFTQAGNISEKFGDGISLVGLLELVDMNFKRSLRT